MTLSNRNKTASSFGRNAFSVSNLSLKCWIGLSVTGRLEGATGLRICLLSIVLDSVSEFDDGGSGVIRGRGLSIGGIGGVGVIDCSCPSTEPEIPGIFPLNQS